MSTLLVRSNEYRVRLMNFENKTADENWAKKNCGELSPIVTGSSLPTRNVQITSFEKCSVFEKCSSYLKQVKKKMSSTLFLAVFVAIGCITLVNAAETKLDSYDGYTLYSMDEYTMMKKLVIPKEVFIDLLVNIWYFTH